MHQNERKSGFFILNCVTQRSVNYQYFDIRGKYYARYGRVAEVRKLRLERDLNPRPTKPSSHSISAIPGRLISSSASELQLQWWHLNIVEAEVTTWGIPQSLGGPALA